MSPYDLFDVALALAHQHLRHTAQAVYEVVALPRNVQGAQNCCGLMQSYFRDLSTIGQTDGLNSGIYSLLTASFAAAGFGYIFAPAQVWSS